jgi:formate dehydrogenase iron-sulfur subunit
VLVAMWIAKGWNRPMRMAQMSSMAQFTFWALVLYLGFRLGDMAFRGQFEGAFAGRLGRVFVAEIVLGGVLPLVLLSRAAWRENGKMLFWGAALAVCGVVLNRVSIVTVAMDPQGPMPRTAPSTYAPSIVEWGISIGLIAATIYLYGVGARRLPLLAKRESAH